MPEAFTREEDDLLIRQLVADMALFPEMNPGPVCRLDQEGNILLANTKAKKLFGEENLVGRSWFDLCPGMNAGVWSKILVCSDVYPFEGKIGESYMVFNHVCPPAKDHFFVYGTDITANKLTEKKLEEQKEIVAEIARFPDMNPGPVIRMDFDSIIILFNAAATAAFGEDMLGKKWKDICPAMTESIWQNILSSTEVIPIETKLGERHFVFNHRTDPFTHLVFAYGTDITANKLTEKKLEEQRAIVAEIARFPDMNPGPVIRLDYESVILLSNAAAENAFGTDMAGKKWKDICPAMTEKTWQKILATTEIYPVETRLSDKDFIFHHRRDPHTQLVFVFGTDITLQRAAERGLRQTEKMATLGTLAAGVAHELNNPAAAVRRSAKQLREAFVQREHAQSLLAGKNLLMDDLWAMGTLAQIAQDKAVEENALDPLTRSDKEAEMEEWLEDRDLAADWNVAPSLVAMGLDSDRIAEITKDMNPEFIGPMVLWAATLFPVYSLVHEIAEGSTRISEIVVALKNYSFLGQAPVQNINIHEGIDNTLIILRNKLKAGITVTKDYSTELPMVTAYGSELNQVWTNILDNAADAMGGKGEITIRTRKENTMAVVEIEDNGPGIPDEIQSRIFDPFFTTKAPGKGTGLGLSTTYGIITEKHKGIISVKSKPGSTKFIVKLPIDGA